MAAMIDGRKKDWDEPANRNPLFDHYHAKFDWQDDEFCEYDLVVQLAIEDGLFAVDDDRFCSGANDLLHHLFLYIWSIPRGLHYAKLILRQADNCVSHELIDVCESLVKFEWPIHSTWCSQEYKASCRWPCSHKEIYFCPWTPTMAFGGCEMVKTDRSLARGLKPAKAKVQMVEAVSEVPF